MIVTTSREQEAISDHLRSIVEIDQQIKELMRKARRESRALELAWAAAYYRCARDTDLPEECPPFIENNEVKIAIEGQTARWVETTDGE